MAPGSPLGRAGLAALALPAFTALATPARADLTYADFTGASGLALNGDAAVVGDRLRVAPGTANQRGSVFAVARQQVTTPFSASFQLDLSGGGEGLAFVIQGAAETALGLGGEGLGYAGMTNAFVLEFDTVASLLSFDFGDNEVAAHSGGTGPVSSNEFANLGLTTLAPNLDGGVRNVRIDYVPGSLRVFVDDTVPTLQVPVDLSALLNLPDTRAWVGFTAATSSTVQNHDVLSFTFTENALTTNGNRPPVAPPINEPVGGGALQNPFDVHMEAAPFSDPDGDTHACSDYEIWTMLPSERVWRTDCISGPERVHTHLGDGVFSGSHAGRTELLAQTAYVMRVRFKDSSGDGPSEWSPWSERAFQTGAASTVYPLDTEDIVQDPAPQWLAAASGSAVVLPAASPAHSVRLESPTGALLLAIDGNDGVTNLVTNPIRLPAHVDVRLTIEAGGAALNQGPTDLVVVTDDCQRVRILVPQIALAAGQTAHYWVSFDGATWDATAGPNTPAFTTRARGASLPWVATQPGYDIEVVASGFRLPVNLVFANPSTNPSAPYLYVTELYGEIKVIRNDGTVSTYASNLLGYTPSGTFPGSGEQGLGGLAIDPVTGDLFAGMLYNGGGGNRYPRVVKFTSTDGGLTAATETTILQMAGETQGQSHFISHCEMLPDRTLLVHMGDGFDAATALNLNSYRGKILRMNLDGSPFTGNPFYNGAPINSRDYVYVHGVRNPFGGCRRISDGFHYCVENGPSVDRFSRIVPGVSYGWAGSDQHMYINALYNWAPATGPVNLAWIEQDLFGGSGFPADKWDHAFVTESGPTWAAGPQARGKRITEFEIDMNGQLISGPRTLVQYAGTGRATVAGLVAGPDGLYFTDLYADQSSSPIAVGANVLRVRWRGANLGTCGSVGQAYCTPAVPNSSGAPAKITARGSSVLVDNDLRLDIEQLPQNTLGYCLVSRTQGNLPQPGGSTGTLCLGGSIGRYVSQAQNSGTAGTFTVMVDLTQLPALSPATVGETLNFQAWFRDFQIMNTSNFSNAVSVTLQ
ncbi:MAG: PQQ-dependent sugar dehydrogenase [Planctomycetota bacterium]